MYQRSFEGDVLSVGAAQEYVRTCLAEGRNSEPVLLLVGELATNAVLRAATSFQVFVVRFGNGVFVGVADSSPDMPVRRSARDPNTRGSGPQLIDAVADYWGVEPRGNGNETWFKVWT